ncbi:glycosyltransferase family 1 protein [Danxiaibacter flavus]|uniref:Glycosyltransferase family 1 protein n=1 Tax=Danxiaibacter flavus TaxID=3049108 RepID=A0ABV3ZGH4_9BACT|nr:glycosyltransferase family 1 protein [Chitinophagaceae bacterium DXS]
MKANHNILFDCEKMRHPNTGVFYFCLNLGQALQKAYNSAREQLHFYTPQNQATAFGNEASYVHHKSWHKFFNPAAGKMDVWHCTYQLSKYLPHNKKTKKIITVHDLNFLVDNPENQQEQIKKIQSLIDRVDEIVCISEHTKRDVLNYLGTSNKPVSVIHNGGGVKEFAGFDAPVYKPSKPFIFSIGMFFAKKNFHVLPCLLKNNDYELIIAGERRPDYEAKILEQAKLYNVSDRIKLIGKISDQDKYWYYKNCLAFAFPSIAEGFGLPVVEAMHFGKPVFLSTHTSLPEIGGKEAFYFNSFDCDAMNTVFEQGLSQFNDELSEKVKARSREFTWEKAAEQYLEIYRSFY